MNDDGLIEKWLEKHDGEDYCAYCIMEECPKGVTASGSGEPIFPPCTDWDFSTELLDRESLLESIKEGKA